MVQANDPFVSFKEVQKSYDGETLVVKNLNLDIASKIPELGLETLTSDHRP